MGSFLSLYSQPTAPPSSSVDELTDEELCERIYIHEKEEYIRFRQPDFDFFAERRLWRITPDAVFKSSSSPTEAFIMAYVSSHTSIPIPKIRRVMAPKPGGPEGEEWIVIDYIEGDHLAEAWKTMSWWKQLSILWTLRGYIRQLQRVPLIDPNIPGPFDGSGKSYKCFGTYFTECGAGPFSSYAGMGDWFNRKRFHTAAAMHAGYGQTDFQCPKFDFSHPLVLCHMDLHMRNLIVDRQGKLWLIDWERAGAFPAWLEYAQCVSWEDAARQDRTPPRLWIQAARWIIGNYRSYVTNYLSNISYALQATHNDDVYPPDYFEKIGLKFD